MTGWNTAEVTRKEVPDQKASIADPLSLSVMIGNAILKDVASNAAASVIIQMEAKANINDFPGLNGVLKSSRGDIDESSFSPAALSLPICGSSFGEVCSLEDNDVVDMVEDRIHGFGD